MELSKHFWALEDIWKLTKNLKNGRKASKKKEGGRNKVSQNLICKQQAQEKQFRVPENECQFHCRISRCLCPPDSSSHHMLSWRNWTWAFLKNQDPQMEPKWSQPRTLPASWQKKDKPSRETQHWKRCNRCSNKSCLKIPSRRMQGKKPLWETADWGTPKTLDTGMIRYRIGNITC